MSVYRAVKNIQIALSAVCDCFVTVSFPGAWADQTKNNKPQSKKIFSGKLSNSRKSCQEKNQKKLLCLGNMLVKK